MRALRLAILAGLAAAPLGAQVPVPGLPGAGTPVIRFSGELGSFGETYRRQGTAGRRPGETGRVFLDANAILFGSVRMGVDLLASTEDGTSLGYGGSVPGRQRISQLGLHPEWSWGRAHLGSYSHGYTPLTYGGVRLTGAALEADVRGMHLGAFGGLASGAVSGGATTGSYRRTIVGGRAGIGRPPLGQPGSFFHIVLTRAWDDPRSLPAPDTTLPPNAPATNGVVPVNPYAVTPEENLVGSASTGLTLLNNRLSWRGELAGAIHTRDRRVAALDPALVDMPGALRRLYTPRVGTHVDYAYSSQLQLRVPTLPGATPASPRSLTANLDYRYVGPGYTSLGLASLGNDQRAIDGRAQVRFARWSLQGLGGYQRDNLLGQKLSTTSRYRAGGTFSFRVARGWNSTVRGSLLTMGNGSADTLRWMDYRALSFGAAQVVSFGPRRRIESLSLDYGFQDAGDGNPLRSSTSFQAHTVNARLAIRVNPALQLHPSAGFASSRSDTASVNRATYGLGAALRIWKGRLYTTANLGRTKYGRAGTWTGSMNTTFRLTAADALVLQVQVNRFRDSAAPGTWFDEQIASLRWARRF